MGKRIETCTQFHLSHAPSARQTLNTWLSSKLFGLAPLVNPDIWIVESFLSFTLDASFLSPLSMLKLGLKEERGRTRCHVNFTTEYILRRRFHTLVSDWDGFSRTNAIHIVNSVLALVLTIILYMCNVILLPSTLYDYRLFVNKEENYHT